MLDTGDLFPEMSLQVLGGGEARVPGEYAGHWAIVLFYRGHW
jgi:hypothetical protein